MNFFYAKPNTSILLDGGYSSRSVMMVLGRLPAILFRCILSRLCEVYLSSLDLDATSEFCCICRWNSRLIPSTSTQNTPQPSIADRCRRQPANPPAATLPGNPPPHCFSLILPRPCRDNEAAAAPWPRAALGPGLSSIRASEGVC